MAEFEKLSPIITKDEKYQRCTWERKQLFWRTLQRAVENCTKQFPDFDVNLTLRSLLDSHWMSYEDAYSFLRSYEVKLTAPLLYECEKKKEKDPMEERLNKIDEEMKNIKIEMEKNIIELGANPEYSQQIEKRLNKIKEEIRKIRKRIEKKEKEPFEKFQKEEVPVGEYYGPNIPSNIHFFERVTYGNIDLECKIYSGYVYTLSPLYKDVAIKTGVIDGPIIKMLKIVEQRRENEDWILVDESGNTYIATVNKRGDVVINAPFAQVPYVWVPEGALSSIASIRGGASKGHIEYLKECVYHYVDNPLIEYIMRGMKRAHADIMRIDELIEYNLSEYGKKYEKHEKDFLRRFLKAYRQTEKECKKLE